MFATYSAGLSLFVPIEQLYPPLFTLSGPSNVTWKVAHSNYIISL